MTQKRKTPGDGDAGSRKENRNRCKTAETNPSPNAGTTQSPADAIAFLKSWPVRLWVLTAIDPESGEIETRTYDPAHELEAAAWIERWNGKRNIYFSVNDVRGPMTKKATKDDIAAAVGLHIDIDCAADPSDGDAWEAGLQGILDRLQEYSPTPSSIVFSGGGYQAFWLFREPYKIEGPADIARIEALNKKLEADLGGDHCHKADQCPRISKEFLAEEMKALGPQRYSEEYELIFRDDDEAVFPVAVIAAAFTTQVQPLWR